LDYQDCVILRKADGSVVTIGDIITGDYLDELIAGATPEQIRAGILQILIEVNENPVTFMAGVLFEFYPYLLLQQGDWVLSEGGNYEKVAADWCYNGNDNSPDWFGGAWPSIHGPGDCVAFCDW